MSYEGGGTPGLQGPTGPTGTNGTNGATGLTGPTGTTGTPAYVYAEITSDLSLQTWTSSDNGTYFLDYNITHGVGSDANVQVTTINGDITTVENCWVVTTFPNAATDNSLRIIAAANPTKNVVYSGPYYLSIIVLSWGTLL
jgi:hypothetical protein